MSKKSRALPDLASQDRAAAYVVAHPERYGPGLQTWAAAYLRRRARETASAEAGSPKVKSSAAA